MKTSHKLVLPLLALLAGGGCSIKRLAVDQTAAILKGAMPAFERDADFDLVEQALPGNIKMMEGMLEAAPDNPDLLLMLAQAYTAYGMLFLEDRLERAEEDSPEAERYAARAKEMYRRAHDYGLRMLQKRHPGLAATLDRGGDALKQALGQCAAEDLPGVFWTGMPLAASINLSKDDVAMIARLPTTKALVARALELDESYYHAGSQMILGALYGGVPRMLGGDHQRSRKHFDRALELTKRSFLLVQVMYAQTLAVQLQDRELFTKLLNEVLQAKLSIDPQQQLANTAAKRRAKRLLDRAEELF